MKKQTRLGLVIAAAAALTVCAASLVSARGWVQDNGEWYYVGSDGDYVTETMQSSGNAKFYLGEDGTMQKDYFLEDYNENTYYFGSNGAMVTNTWVAIESDRVENQGDYVPDNYWYYFQSSGKAMKGSSGSPKKTTIDGKKYMFNEYGQMCTGWCDSQGQTINPDDETNPFQSALYYAGGDNDGVLRAGWVTYYDGFDGDGYLGDKSNLYFYFNTNNNKKVPDDDMATTKKINGKTYAFNNYGVMVSGWDVVKDEDGDLQAIDAVKGKVVYFSGDDDGHQVKKGWVYAVPAESVDSKAHADDEEKYFYFNNSGEAVYDQFKKVNGKYYAFAANGIMKTGIVLWNPSAKGVNGSLGSVSTDDPHFKGTIDLDYAQGSDLVKKGIVQVGSDEYFFLSPNGYTLKSTTSEAGLNKEDVANRMWGSGNYTETNMELKLHNFGNDGARKTGNNTVEFADDTYTLNTNASGDKGSGAFSKKYYQFGILLKASADIKYGIYVSTPGYQLQNQKSEYGNRLWALEYKVLNTSGSGQKGGNSAKKDADGNYWLIDKDQNLIGIFSKNVKLNSTSNGFKLKNYWSQPAACAASKSIGCLAENAASAIVYNSNGKNINTGDQFLSLTALKNSGNDILTLDWVKLTDKAEDGNDMYAVYVNGGQQAYQYQSDYENSSSKWIPFGVLDNARKTPSLKYNDNGNDGCAYIVTPNTDYFVNAYWQN